MHNSYLQEGIVRIGTMKMPIRMPFARGDDGLTALMLAGMEGHTDIVKALLAGDVDVNVRSDDGTTALKVAS